MEGMNPDEWRKEVELDNIKQSDLIPREDSPIELTLEEYNKYKEEIKILDGESVMNYAVRLNTFPKWKTDSVRLFEDRWKIRYGVEPQGKIGEQLNLF